MGAALALPSTAFAGLTLTPLIIDMAPNRPSTGDAELYNNGGERLYVVVEPSRIDAPGLKGEARISDPDPEKVGMIATPARLILEPGQRKFVRLLVLQPPGEVDRIFRVTVKPVTGEVNATVTGLKLLVGYDMLVIQRPAKPQGAVAGVRQGDVLTLTNTGSTNAEIFRGKSCEADGKTCTDLPSERIYAGASVTVPVKAGSTATYTVKVTDKVAEQSF